VSARGFLVVNPRSGDGTVSTDEVVEEAGKRGIEVHLLQPGDDVPELARKADAEALGAGGGDGTLGAVASVAVERDLPFFCVPLGTRNHFARDLGLDPDDPLAALDWDGECTIDVGRAGERLFLNNVAIGLYAGLVREREGHGKRRRGLLATARALLRSLRHRPDKLTIDGRQMRGRIVLAANNYYELSLFSLGRREHLDEGRLHLYVAEGLVPGRWQAFSGESFTVDARSRKLRAAFDGEPGELEPPVEFRIEPAALRVLVPGDPGS
jgi:diacylglycerol kinase family enzyme